MLLQRDNVIARARQSGISIATLAERARVDGRRLYSRALLKAAERARIEVVLLELEHERSGGELQ